MKNQRIRYALCSLFIFGVLGAEAAPKYPSWDGGLEVLTKAGGKSKRDVMLVRFDRSGKYVSERPFGANAAACVHVLENGNMLL